MGDEIPVVFIHGLWLLPSSWDAWTRKFEAAGYRALAPGWPDDPPTVAAARERPEVMAGKTIGAIADHLERTVRALGVRPALVGHSLGGLLTQILAGRGLAAVSVAIDPAPFRGVLPVPPSALRAAWPVLRNPANRHRAIMPSYDEFRYTVGNAVGAPEAKTLYETYVVPATGAPIFQAATANLDPRTEAKVDCLNLSRGPLLLVSGGKDNAVPPAIVRAEYRRQRRNPGVTELAEMRGRGHSLVIDSGWEEVAEIALAFVRRFAPAS